MSEVFRHRHADGGRQFLRLTVAKELDLIESEPPPDGTSARTWPGPPIADPVTPSEPKSIRSLLLSSGEVEARPRRSSACVLDALHGFSSRRAPARQSRVQRVRSTADDARPTVLGCGKYRHPELDPAGCAKVTAPVLPFSNAARGIGGFNTNVSAGAYAPAYPNASSNGGMIAVELTNRIPLSLFGGSHAVNASWNLTGHGVARAAHYPKVSAKGRGCWDIARFMLSAGARVREVTTRTWSTPGWSREEVSGMAELDDVFGWIPEEQFNGSFQSAFNLSGTFNATHHYEVVTAVFGTVSADVATPNALRTLMVTYLHVSSHAAPRLAWIKIW